MAKLADIAQSDTDAAVDTVIAECLTPTAPKSFFLYAGAGSGKTYSLVEGLKHLANEHGEYLKATQQRIAVITYTNAASDEIVERVEENSLFDIRTIHSFCWSQISSLHTDIRKWLLQALPIEIADLEIAEAKGRPGTKTSIARQRSIADKRTRLDWLRRPRLFTYNPNGDNVGRASLSHSEVLKITADFLRESPSFQAILTNRYPFLLVDESQDTNANLIDAFFALEEATYGRFGLGLIGDMMQRIYADGKADLDAVLPDRWARPVKQLNRRCPRRIVGLANAIRNTTDKKVQNALDSSQNGELRLFVSSNSQEARFNIENDARQRMAELTGDAGWTSEADVKSLTLEHRMAARRMGFDEMFAPLYASSKLSTGTMDGSLPAVRLFAENVRPVLEAHNSDDKYRVMALLRSLKSPLLDRETLQTTPTPDDPLAPVREALEQLQALCAEDRAPRFLDVLHLIAKTRLFRVPKSLRSFAEAMDVTEAEEDSDTLDETITDSETESTTLKALGDFLEAPYEQIHAYRDYINDAGPFDTHQGVKGREFDRVMVIMDDEEARGFMFSYDKLFAVKPATPGDLKKMAEGAETGIDRTKRLFYVTCTRAQKSLCLLAYTDNPVSLRSNVIKSGWFSDEEVVII